MITLAEYFWPHIEKPSEEVQNNALELLARINQLLECAAGDGVEAASAPHVNSGWRPAHYNASVPGAAAKSKHITGQALDLADPDGELDGWCMDNLDVLEGLGLWLEDPASTRRWSHLQSVPPRSLRRVFFP